MIRGGPVGSTLGILGLSAQVSHGMADGYLRHLSGARELCWMLRTAA